MKWNLKSAHLGHREPSQPKDSEEMLVGDIYEFTDPPFYEIDPKTMKPTTTLQKFRVKNDRRELEPIHDE